MHRGSRTFLAAGVLLLAFAGRPARATDRVVLLNGSVLRGRVTSQTDTTISVKTRGGLQMTFPLSQVHTVTTAAGRKVFNASAVRPRRRQSPTRSIQRRTPRKRAASIRRGRPAYETESWPKARLLVWANPGRSGRFEEARNWKENGRPARRPPDKDTDLLLPAASTLYTVIPTYKKKIIESGVVAGGDCRHATVERNACLFASHQRPINLWGNIWVKPGGRSHFVNVRGPRNTFYRLDDGRYPAGRGSGRYGVSWGMSEAQNRESILRSHRTHIMHKMQVSKYKGASVEFIGKMGIGDEFQLQAGKMIIAPDAEFRYNGVVTKGVFEIFSGGTLELQSGATLAPYRNFNSEGIFNMSIYRGGTLQAGSPQRPISKDAYLLVGFTDDSGRKNKSGLYCARGSKIRVYSRNPRSARLVFSSITSRADFHDSRGRRLGDPGRSAQGNTGIQVNFGGDIQLDGVMFDYVRQGGIKLASNSMRSRWKNVIFGSHNAGRPDQLFGRMTINADIAYHKRRFDRYLLVKHALNNMKKYTGR